MTRIKRIIIMLLKHLVLQHFRSYTQSDFAFSPDVTYVVGPNTSGKSNLLEAIYLLTSGRSYRAESDSQMVQFGEEIGRVKGLMVEAERQSDKDAKVIDEDRTELEVVIVEDKEFSPSTSLREEVKRENGKRYRKKYFVNGVVRSRIKFAWNLQSLLFVPSHLDLIVGSPSLRRGFFDEVLELVDPAYRHAILQYEKAIRQRNALLQTTRETGIRNESQFSYWNSLVITNGQIITKKREELVAYINASNHDVADISVSYDVSTISDARLEQYKAAEVASGVTLVGPHRDDFSVSLRDRKVDRNVRHFGSRGQQRLVVLQLKLLQLSYIERIMGSRPLLLLDDIFSELDESHIQLVMDMVSRQQTIITTTHEEFLSGMKKDSLVIELG
jgi:DNA replication and repair protein RecF